MNEFVNVYIGDFKINTDSHRFIESYTNTSWKSSFDLTNKIPVIDIDYSNLNKNDILDIVTNCKKQLVLCTLYPDKIDKSLKCQIFYKDDWIDKTGENLWEIVKQCFHEKDRWKLIRKLKETKISTHLLNKWLHGNPTESNMSILKMLDDKMISHNPDMWIDIMALTLSDGPMYPRYRFKKNV